MTQKQDRNPYVGAGEDGAWRSARIDREELDGLDDLSPRWEEVYASAQAWEAQAWRHVHERIGARPTIAQVGEGVGNEAWLAALRILSISATVQADAAQFTEWSRGGRFVDEPDGPETARIFMPDPSLDWEAWVADVDEHGRGWSSTEHRLYELVAGLVIRGRTVDLVDTLGNLGSWERDILQTLVTWASGGTPTTPGRLTVERVAR